MSNGDLVDPIDLLREQAQNSSKCRSFVEKLQACGERQPKTKESCEEEFIDLLECSDTIVASQIFKVLK
ncbi:Cytochrome b-c1 complex subunit 6, mitochondrial [Clonorchis sinensis]|uniref:Cytochrome b-c1 complex subunit 6, mitochondrial n=1 Tax=Clonorchis sinensis TaxID=79923 RepID=A0A8T1M4P9_CLOSI|nr:Cytochrome b-c1 complex subunit 6, mitochondrial [Clonorchis sinensis]